MKVRLAKKIGFCFGVRRAIEMAEVALRSNSDVYALSSIIHNEQVVNDLSSRGLKVIKDIGRIKKGVVIIPSHGISPKIADALKKKRLKIIDATCPFVLKAQETARRLSEAGYSIIIVGDANHPEIKALVDFISGGVFIVKDKEGAKRLAFDQDEKYCVISQTTQATDNFMDVVKTIADKRPKELKVVNTICKDAEKRQKAASELAGEVDAMFIVGGRNSANTRRLSEVCGNILRNSHLVETRKDLKNGWVKPSYVIGITSGASTPDWVVKSVVDKIKQKRRLNK